MYLVLDIETVRDPDVMSQACRRIEAWDGDTPSYETEEACLEREEAKICAQQQGDNCFWPLRFQKPVLASLIAVDARFNYLGHKTVWGRSIKRVAEDFWQLIGEAPGAFGTQHIVTFNGKRFDMPVMEIAAMRYGIQCPWWFRDPTNKPWDQPRSFSSANRIHLDMLNELATSGPTGGDLNFWSHVFGLPGKVDSNGADVADLFEAEEWDRIQDYCLCDVLNTLGLLMGLYNMCYPELPGPRSQVFEHTMNTIIEARKAEGAPSTELERYWKLYGSEIPF